MLVLEIAIGIAIAGVAGVAARYSAQRKGRSEAWMAFAVIFPPSLLLLACLPNVKSMAEKEPNRRWFALPLEILGILAVLSPVLFSVGRLSVILLKTGSLDGPPKCDSSFTTDLAKRAFAEGPSQKLSGLKIIALDNLEEVSASATTRQCRAVATLNSAAEHRVIIDLEKHGDGWFLTIHMPPS